MSQQQSTTPQRSDATALLESVNELYRSCENGEPPVAIISRYSKFISMFMQYMILNSPHVITSLRRAVEYYTGRASGSEEVRQAVWSRLYNRVYASLSQVADTLTVSQSRFNNVAAAVTGFIMNELYDIDQLPRLLQFCIDQLSDVDIFGHATRYLSGGRGRFASSAYSTVCSVCVKLVSTVQYDIVALAMRTPRGV